VVTAPVELREELAGLNARRLVDRCCSFRPGRRAKATAAAKYALRLLARRHSQLTSEIEGVDKELVRLTAETAPALVHAFGIGPDTAATLLVTAGSNPERLRSEPAFAALCGVNPIPASSGKTDRHRLNRGGDRQANAALYRVVLVRLRYD
jgi:transposase